MGREAKILLGLLGLLAGVFCGVLSMKLLVPRPPAGAGPDIHGASTFGETTAIVEPPLFVPAFPIRAADFAAAPPLVHDAGPPVGGSPDTDFATPADLIAESPVPSRFERNEPAITETPASLAPASEDLPADDDLLLPPAEFVLAPPARHIDDMTPPSEGPRDPFVAPTRWQPPETAGPAGMQPTALPGTALPHVTLAGTTLPIPPAGIHVVQSGDSWWSLAEATYGDGRFYRALFAWNRAVDPRITLAAGTELELPPAEKLRAAWPKLIPPVGR